MEEVKITKVNRKAPTTFEKKSVGTGFFKDTIDVVKNPVKWLKSFFIIDFLFLWFLLSTIVIIRIALIPW